MSGLLPIWDPKTHYFLEKFFCVLLNFAMFNEPYLLLFPGDLCSFCENRSQFGVFSTDFLNWCFEADWLLRAPQQVFLGFIM